MLYAYYDSEVFYSLLLLQQLEVASPYAELLASVRKKKKKKCIVHTLFIVVKYQIK